MDITPEERSQLSPKTKRDLEYVENMISLFKHIGKTFNWKAALFGFLGGGIFFVILYFLTRT